MKVLDYLLDQDIDVTVIDICDGTQLSRKTVDLIVESLIDNGLLSLARTIGKTKMIKLNLDNPIARKLKDINNLVLKNQEAKLENPIIN